MKQSTVAVAVSVVLGTFASAGLAGLSAFSQVEVGNEPTGNPTRTAILDSDNSSGAPVFSSVEKDFTGTDNTGNARTMHLSADGSASAQYQHLHADAVSTVSNAFYAPDRNTPYVEESTGVIHPNGVPDTFKITSQASFSEKLQYGSTAINYTSRYFLRLDGLIDNIGSQPSYVFVILKHGNNTPEQFFFNNAGDYSIPIYSKTYVGGGNEFFSLTLQVGVHTGIDFVEDGDAITGLSNFGNTLNLVGIEARNAATGELLADGSITGESSGMSYAVVVVPEPTTILGAGILLSFLKRRRCAGQPSTHCR